MFFHKLFLDFFSECLWADSTSAIFEYNSVGIGYEHPAESWGQVFGSINKVQ